MASIIVITKYFIFPPKIENSSRVGKKWVELFLFSDYIIIDVKKSNYISANEQKAIEKYNKINL